MNITWEVSKHGGKLRLVVEAQMDEDGEVTPGAPLREVAFEGATVEAVRKSIQKHEVWDWLDVESCFKMGAALARLERA